MTISIPVSAALVDTDVIDITAQFNPAEHLTSYPAGVKYQYENDIYQNTGDTIPIKEYVLADEGTYTDGQILFKDNVNNAHYYIAGEFPKQPDNYTATQNTGVDATAWTSRYSKLATVPGGFVGNKKVYNNNYKKAKMYLSSDGTVGIATGSSGGVAKYTLSEAYNVETAIEVAGTTLLVGGIVENDWVVSPDGLHIIFSEGGPNSRSENTVQSYTLSSAWNPSTGTLNGNFVVGNYGTWNTYDVLKGITVNSTGTVLYTISSDSSYTRLRIKKYTMSTAWNVVGMSYVSEQVWAIPTFDAANSYVGTFSDIKLLANGTKVAFVRYSSGTTTLHVFSLGTAYDMMSTKTLVGLRRFDGFYIDYFHFNGTGTKLYTYASYYWYTHYMNTGYDVFNALYGTNEFDIYEKGSTYIRRWKFKWDGSQYVSTTYAYQISNGNPVFTSSGITDTSLYTVLDNDSIEKMALYPVADGISNDTWQIKTLIWTSAGVYVRTHVVISAEFETLNYHAYFPLVTPLDIAGFSLIEATNDYKPFDGKNYSAAISNTATMFYIVKGDVASFDTIALGRVKADSVQAVFKLSDGTTITDVTRAIDRGIDSQNVIGDADTTVILYATEFLPVDSTVEITLTANTGVVELGTIMLGQSVAAGFSNLSLKHSYIDFSNAVYDPFGNLDYVEKQKIATYNGSVDVDITDYDRMIRLFTYLGKKLVIVNGSTSKTKAPDSKNVFASTQKIGRFMSFSQQDNITDGEIERKATYTFDLEELV